MEVHVYPTVVVRTIKDDTSESYYFTDKLLIFNEVLKELVNSFESTVVSNEYSDFNDKFKVDSQPKFTLENVEAFVCSSQVNICLEGEELDHQCTFENGRQANICDDKKRLPHTLRIGKSTTEFEKEYRIPTLYTDGRYNTVKKNAQGDLSGVHDSLSFEDGDIEYSFENHWSARSRDDYDFHAEFNIRKNGEIIESNRCLEGDYKIHY